MIGRRVAITGLGVVAPCGIGQENFWSGLLGPGITGGKWKTITDWDPLPWFNNNAKEARRADRVEQFAVAAAAEAMAQAGELGIDPTRFGVIIGTGIGGLGTLEEQIEIRLARGERRVSPFLVPMMMANASGAAISMKYGLQGPNETICTACAASTHALGYAARLIAMGRCDAIVSGGSEAAATPSSLAGFNNMTALSSTGQSRPFDRDRDGFVMGEGAGIFVLEAWDHAVARGANILGEILGSASNADAHHITAPSPGGRGAINCMRLALDEAELNHDAIVYVNAHGTSTPLNDAAEAAAMATVFPHRPAVTSIKGVTGHALGAAGALEAASVLLSFQHKLIPATAGTQHLDDDVSIDLVMGSAREWKPGPTMSNNFGFGGHNGSVILAPA
jgi:3-oxoacyl-[acyl-carrier-protein] synthase II